MWDADDSAICPAGTAGRATEELALDTAVKDGPEMHVALDLAPAKITNVNGPRVSVRTGLIPVVSVGGWGMVRAPGGAGSPARRWLQLASAAEV